MGRLSEGILTGNVRVDEERHPDLYAGRRSRRGAKRDGGWLVANRHFKTKIIIFQVRTCDSRCFIAETTAVFDISENCLPTRMLSDVNGMYLWFRFGSLIEHTPAQTL